MDRDEYKQKLDSILSASDKFTVQTRSPTLLLKIQLNQLIKSANDQSKDKLFDPRSGEYRPGYIY